MKTLFVNLLMLVMLAAALPATAQQQTITINGKVTSFEESLPLEGVVVQVKGSSNNTGTQPDGSFSLPVSSDDKVLLLRLPGYEKQEVLLTKAREYSIVLKRISSFAYSKYIPAFNTTHKQHEMLK